MRIFSNRKKYKESQPRHNRKLISMSGGTVIHADSAMEVSAFYRGVIYISTQLAKLPWQVKNKNNEVLSATKINTIINLAANPEVNSMMLRLFLIQSALINGNGYAEIERNIAGKVTALWPIPHHDVDVTRLDTGELIYRIIGGGNAGGDVFLRKHEMYHVRNFHTKDGITGLGLLDYAAETLGTAKGADKFANSLFATGGMPSGVLSVDGKLSPEATARIKESWEAAHSGRKTGGTAILEEGLKYEAISHDPAVMQFLQSRQFSVLEIARFLGLPPTKLFDATAATFNNIENANLEVATDTLDAWARNLEIEADIKLLSNGHGGNKTEFDMQAIFRGDMETRGQYFTSQMQAGAITPNQIRIAEGRAPYDGGDRYYIATNNFTPQDRVDEVISAQIKPKEVPESKEDEVVAKYLSNK